MVGTEVVGARVALAEGATVVVEVTLAQEDEGSPMLMATGEEGEPKLKPRTLIPVKEPPPERVSVIVAAPSGQAAVSWRVAGCGGMPRVAAEAASKGARTLCDGALSLLSPVCPDEADPSATPRKK